MRAGSVAKDDHSAKFVGYPMGGSGETTFGAASGHAPRSYRRIQSLTQSLAGELEREQRAVAFATTVIPATILFLHQFDRYTGGGVFVSHFFVATSTKLYKFVGTPPAIGTWSEVTAVGTLVRAPVSPHSPTAPRPPRRVCVGSPWGPALLHLKPPRRSSAWEVHQVVEVASNRGGNK